MFTDSPTTPVRVEVLLELVIEMRQRKLDRASLRHLVQPDGLPGVTEKSNQAMDTLKAALELELVKEDAEKNIRPNWETREALSGREVLIRALEEKVLKDTEVEPYFAPFYAFLIAQNSDTAGPGADGTRWAEAFNRDVYGGRTTQDPFNKDKYTGLRRWLRYAGLGWHDIKDNFVPCPYERMKRQLPSIFGRDKKLDGSEFMRRLGTHCPELDGGRIFREVNKQYDASVCTRAVASVLRDMHDEDTIALNCPLDSRGPSLELAGTEREPKRGLNSDRVDAIELRTRR